MKLTEQLKFHVNFVILLWKTVEEIIF